MKNSNILILCTSTIFLLTACGEEPKESRAETLNNPVDTYLDSRVDAMDMAKRSVKESNKRSEERDKAMESLIK